MTPQPGARPGRRFVTASIEEPSGQVIEDSALLCIGQPPPPRLDLPLRGSSGDAAGRETAQAGEADVSLVSPTPGDQAGRG